MPNGVPLDRFFYPALTHMMSSYIRVYYIGSQQYAVFVDILYLLYVKDA